MTSKLPDSLESEINQFLEGFTPAKIVFSEEGLKEIKNHYKTLKEQDKVLFNIKYYLAEARRINNTNK